MAEFFRRGGGVVISRYLEISLAGAEVRKMRIYAAVRGVYDLKSYIELAKVRWGITNPFLQNF